MVIIKELGYPYIACIECAVIIDGNVEVDVVIDIDEFCDVHCLCDAHIDVYDCCDVGHVCLVV